MQKAIRTIEWTGGVVEEVTDQQIMDAKAVVDGVGIGCEPASACSVAGTKKLVSRGLIKRGDAVVGLLTGHILKDPEAAIGYHANQLGDIVPRYRNAMLQAEDNIDEIIRLLRIDAPAP